jgi:hypothetical protein
MATRRSRTRGLTDEDVQRLRDQLGDGRRPRVRVSGPQFDGDTSATVVRIGDPALDGTDYVTVRVKVNGMLDELAFAPAELNVGRAQPAGRRTRAATKAPATKAPTAKTPAATTPTATAPTATAPMIKAPATKASAAKAPAAKPAATRPAADAPDQAAPAGPVTPQKAAAAGETPPAGPSRRGTEGELHGGLVRRELGGQRQPGR